MVMQNANEQYLQSLLHWSEEVEAKVDKTHMSEENKKEWNLKLEKWRKTIKQSLKKDSISEEEIKEIQKQGHALIYNLGEYYDEERQKKAVPIGKHKLPPLPYAYDALEPYISKEIMKLHHDVHHKSYVDGLNEAETKLEESRITGDDKLLKHWLRQQSFNGSGHFLHTIFWNNMNPRGGGKPSGALMKQINKDFGSFEKFKKQFSSAAKSVEGVGWALLVWEPRSHRLTIQTTEKHQMFSLWDVIPLLVLDVWEHAYYLQYKTKRGDYVSNWWNVVNWEDAASRFSEAKKLTWTPY